MSQSQSQYILISISSPHTLVTLSPSFSFPSFHLRHLPPPPPPAAEHAVVAFDGRPAALRGVRIIAQRPQRPGKGGDHDRRPAEGAFLPYYTASAVTALFLMHLHPSPPPPLPSSLRPAALRGVRITAQRPQRPGKGDDLLNMEGWTYCTTVIYR